jgi:Holliday junction DNA helicase RuvA
MYSYIKGLVVEINSTYIVIDNNGIGYKINVSNPYSFHENEESKVFIYQHIREDENSLYGFKTIEEKDLFLKLLEVKGVGPKTILPMLATGSVSGIMDAINRENILYLKKFPKIGDKVAKQIILDLKGKFKSNIENISIDTNDELVEVLKGLGYKTNDIFKIIPKISKNLSIEEQIKEALKMMLK